ncbi:hypothetical protein HYH02_007636 [Chlamydomonas schloesseri]|uniref:Protein kinase domain-containing protein n=1 Tax=Chlamydomonas schloesseri TaxID=2026947 RepID=A0A836B4B3_9CHLO|nr:hypothetical protein HYH02_007636 [Chlamydomonas schloesseri]|eukprot:KAG2447306.1 hypothetical protein HYH02_007636 [Chlamydomonas schloesseri]
MGLFSSSIFGSDASPAKSPGAFQSNSEGYDTLMSSYGGGALLTRTLHSPGPTPPPQRKLSHLSQASPCVHGTSWDGRPTGLAAPLSSAAGTPMASLSAAGASTGAGAVSPLPRSSGGDRPLPPMPMPPAAIPRSPPTVLSTERLIALLPHNRDGSVAAARSGSIPLQQPASPSSSPRPYPPATLGAALSATAAATIHTPSGGTLRASNSVRRALRAFSSNLETADAEPVALVRGARGAGAGSVCVGGSGQGQDTSCALKPESETSRRSTDDGIAPSSLLLAASPALPSAMSRPVWSLEDYTISRRLYKGSSSAVYKERSAPGSSAPSTKVVLVQEYAARGDLFDVHERLGGRMKPTHPANVLFTTDWRLLVADFGVSINLHQERAVTRAGTEGYMAPEVERCPLKAEPQENKDKPQLAYSTAVDIWAVGCMAYELMLARDQGAARHSGSSRSWSPSGATSDCSGEDSGRLIVLDGSTVESPYLFGRRSSSFGPSLPPMVQQNQPQHMPRRHHAPPHRNLSHLSNTTTPRGSWDGRGAAILASPLPAGACVGGGPSPPLLPAGPAGRPGANAPAAATKQPPYHQSHMAASLMRSMGNFRGGGPHCAMPAVTAEPTSPLASPQAYLRASAGPSAILEPSAAPPSASAAAAQAAAGTTSTPHHYAAARPHADGSGLWRRAHQQAPAAAAARAHSSNLETLDRALTAIQRGGGVAQHPAAAGAAAAWTEAADPDAAASGARRARSSGCDPAASVSAAATSATGAPSSLLLAVSPALPSAMGRPVWSLDDYSISRRLYKGSSSAVYKATCLRSTLPVALKVYFLNRLPGNCLHMLKREIQINIGLVHKHVALLYGAFLERGEPGASAPSTKVVLVQEYAAHGDLYNVKQKLGGRIKAPQVANLVMRPLLEALAHMHSQGILHRDIKPANVLFTTDWRLLVADFGVSINLHQERAVTRAGTEGYMAPEVERCPLKAEPQENKDKPQLAYSTAVDIWAVGCMAYELMVGFPPAIMPQEQWAQLVSTGHLAHNKDWIIDSAPCQLSAPQSPVAVSASQHTFSPSPVARPGVSHQAWPIRSDVTPPLSARNDGASLSCSPPSGASTPLMKLAGAPLARLLAASRSHEAPQRALSQGSIGLSTCDASECPKSPPQLPTVQAESQPAASVPEPASASACKVLAVSPALPSSMSRPVWALEDYAISCRLYKSSSSSVYKATCQRSGLPVALKVYFLERIPANVVHMLRREIEIHISMVHPHILRLHCAFLDNKGRLVLVQEYGARGDLYNVAKRLGGRMQPDQVAHFVMRPFLEALSYLHSRGICHRDIKPENVLFTTDWRLLVADFGVSINLHQERAVTRAGTEGYMAPEVERCPLKAEPQENKDKPQLAYSTAVDIWAVGCMAYELMVGFPPAITQQDKDANSLAGFVANEMTAAALHFPASVPTAARAWIQATLSPDPADRPAAMDLLQAPWLATAASVLEAKQRPATANKAAGQPAGGSPPAHAAATVTNMRSSAVVA